MALVAPTTTGREVDPVGAATQMKIKPRRMRHVRIAPMKPPAFSMTTWFLLFFMVVHRARSFNVPSPRSRRQHRGIVYMGDDSNTQARFDLDSPGSESVKLSNNEAEVDATGEKLLSSERFAVQGLMAKLDFLESSVSASESESGGQPNVAEMAAQLRRLEQSMDRLDSVPLPPQGVSIAEYQASIQLLLSLPPYTRMALVKALGFDEGAARDIFKLPEVVKKASDEMGSGNFATQQLEDARQQVRKILKEKAEKSNDDASSNQGSVLKALSGDDATVDGLLEQMYGKSRDEMRVDTTVKGFLNRVARKEGIQATEEDLKTLMKALTQDSSLFVPTGASPLKIPGGWAVRGTNKAASGSELIKALDARLPPQESWNGTVSWMLDISDPDLPPEEMFSDSANALVLLHKDFSPETSPWFYRLCSAMGITTALLFAVGVYGSNDIIANQLIDSVSVNGLNGFNWFNGKVADILLPLSVIVTVHEVGHFVTAKKYNISTSSTLPTLLPCWGSLPLVGTLTRIASSPPNLNALFDFAIAGPALGLIMSFGFFFYGLDQTQAIMNAGSNAAQYLPALPVSILRLSTLGGTIVDTFFGGDGFITSQDPSTPVALHPYAIAGFVGMLINGLDLIPQGSTDGGRMGLSVFGRQLYSIVGGTIWIALLVASFTLSDESSSALVAVWLVNSFTQNDQEVPSRVESEQANLVRCVAALATWFLAALIVIPMT